jgi:ABC-type transport system involved in multi-copper enzyme maturation permease subunit
VNPIVRRELLDLFRTRAALAVLVAFALSTAILVLLHWPVGGVGDLGGTAALGVLRVFGYGLLTGLLLVLPAFPAAAIVRERVRGTLALLLNTPMSPAAIYGGKFGGAMGFTIILLVLTLPGAAASYALGGSTVAGGVGLLYLVLGIAAVEVIAIALFISGRSTATDGSLRAAYVAVLAVTLLPLAAHFLMPRNDAPRALAANWLGSISPVPAVMEAVGHGGLGVSAAERGSGAVARYCLVALATTAVLALITVRGLTRMPLDRARAAGVMTEDRSTLARALRRIVFLVDPSRRSGGTSLLFNPVMVKELRTRRFGRAHWMLRLTAGAGVLSLALSYIAAAGAFGLGLDVIGGALVLLQSSLLLLFVPSLGSGLISAEREGGTWPLLRTTPLSAGAILRGKLLSAVWPVLLLLCATLPGYLVMVSVKPETTSQVGRVLLSLALLAAFAVLVGAAASSLFRSTAVATAVAYMILAALCIAPLLVWLGRDAPFGHEVVRAALIVDPIAAALGAVDMPGFRNYDLVPTNWLVIGGSSLILLVLLVVRIRRLYRPD